MNDYWKLEEADENADSLREALENGGYNMIPKNATLPVLRDEWDRMQQGLLHYDKYTTDELNRFIAQRGLRLQSWVRKKKSKTAGRRQAIGLLKAHDDTPTFTNLLALPNELQSHIVELYMDFDNPLLSPTPPPLAQTSQHLRQLALPIFYKTQRFALLYSDESKYGTVAFAGFHAPDRVFKLDLESRVWLALLSPKQLSCVRSLVLSSNSFDGIDIDLDASAAGFKIEVTEGLYDHDGRVIDKQRRTLTRQALTRELEKVLEQVEWVEGMRRFKIDDVYRIRIALEAAYKGLPE